MGAKVERQRGMQLAAQELIETRAEIEKLQRALLSVEGLIPTNWCDSLLTGSGGITVPATCPDIERLLLGVRDRIRALVKEALPEKGND